VAPIVRLTSKNLIAMSSLEHLTRGVRALT